MLILTAYIYHFHSSASISDLASSNQSKMIILISFATASLLFTGLILMRLLSLKSGILRNDGRMFLTHNTVFRVTKNGKLYLQARGGKFTDQFCLKISPKNIDMEAFSNGQRIANSQLDNTGYLIFRVIHIQTLQSEPPLRTLVGGFTLNSAAQKRFSTFLLKNFPQQIGNVVHANYSHDLGSNISCSKS